MRVMVTGCAGQVCSHICDALLAKGHNVYGLDNHLSGAFNTPEGVTFIRKDLRDFTRWPDVDAVVHGASYAELAGNWNDLAERQKLFEHNERATRSLLEHMPEVPIVYLSSASVYGSQCAGAEGRLGEDARLSIESPYAASKAACELYVEAWAFKRKTPWYVLRLCNQIGSRTHRGLVPDFVRMAKAGHIHARDDGSQKRSWIHVTNTAKAIVELLERQAPSGKYNVASRELWSWRDLVKLMGFTGRVTHEPRREGAIGDPVDLRLDASRIEAYAGALALPVASAFHDALRDCGWPRPPIDDMAPDPEPAVP